MVLMFWETAVEQFNYKPKPLYGDDQLMSSEDYVAESIQFLRLEDNEDYQALKEGQEEKLRKIAEQDAIGAGTAQTVGFVISIFSFIAMVVSGKAAAAGSFLGGAAIAARGIAEAFKSKNRIDRIGKLDKLKIEQVEKLSKKFNAVAGRLRHKVSIKDNKILTNSQRKAANLVDSRRANKLVQKSMQNKLVGDVEVSKELVNMFGRSLDFAEDSFFNNSQILQEKAKLLRGATKVEFNVLSESYYAAEFANDIKTLEILKSKNSVALANLESRQFGTTDSERLSVASAIGLERVIKDLQINMQLESNQASAELSYRTSLSKLSSIASKVTKSTGLENLRLKTSYNKLVQDTARAIISLNSKRQIQGTKQKQIASQLVNIEQRIRLSDDSLAKQLAFLYTGTQLDREANTLVLGSLAIEQRGILEGIFAAETAKGINQQAAAVDRKINSLFKTFTETKDIVDELLPSDNSSGSINTNDNVSNLESKG